MICADSKVGAAGPQSGSYVAVDSWANLQAYVSASYAGCKLRCNDVGINGSDWRVNDAGTSLVIDSPITMYREENARARAPSGTIGTGASGNITFGTAAPRAYTEGLYVYLPSIATTPAITAGWYWCVMSTTTLGTLYASKGGAAINFSAGASYTGVTTQLNHPGLTVKGGLLSTNRQINVNGIITATANANTKTTFLNFGGSNAAANNLTIAYTPYNTSISNKGVTNAQVVTSGLFSASTTTTYLAIDTTADFAVNLYLTNGSTATDWWCVENCRIVLNP